MDSFIIKLHNYAMHYADYVTNNSKPLLLVCNNNLYTSYIIIIIVVNANCSITEKVTVYITALIIL